MTMENILKRGLTFRPTFFVPSKRKRSKWKTLDGQLVDPVKPGTIKDCREFIDKYSAGSKLQHIWK